MSSFGSVFGDIHADRIRFLPVLLLVALVLTGIRRLRNRGNGSAGGRAAAEDQQLTRVFQGQAGSEGEHAARAEAESEDQRITSVFHGEAGAPGGAGDSPE